MPYCHCAILAYMYVCIIYPILYHILYYVLHLTPAAMAQFPPSVIAQAKRKATALEKHTLTSTDACILITDATATDGDDNGKLKV